MFDSFQSFKPQIIEYVEVEPREHCFVQRYGDDLEGKHDLQEAFCLLMKALTGNEDPSNPSFNSIMYKSVAFFLLCY